MQQRLVAAGFVGGSGGEGDGEEIFFDFRNLQEWNRRMLGVKTHQNACGFAG